MQLMEEIKYLLIGIYGRRSPLNLAGKLILGSIILPLIFIVILGICFVWSLGFLFVQRD
jgi:hypothetical protein